MSTITPIIRHDVLLMATCLCDSFFPEAAIATVRALEASHCNVIFPEDQTCCGQPAFSSGDFDSGRTIARHTAKVFAGNRPIIVPSGGCAAMHQQGNKLQFEGQPDYEDFVLFGRRTWELFDFLVNALEVNTWPGTVEKRVAIHHSCHTRYSDTTTALTTLLSSIKGITLLPFGEGDQCCGFGGTFSVSFPNISRELGCIKIDHILEAEPDVVVSADMSCLMHLRGLAEKSGQNLPTQHAAELLAEALDSTS